MHSVTGEDMEGETGDDVWKGMWCMEISPARSGDSLSMKGP